MEEIHSKSKGEKVIETTDDPELKYLEMEEIQKPSKGEKLLTKIKEGELFKKETEIKKGKAIEKIKKGKYGLPVDPNRKNWDMI